LQKLQQDEKSRFERDLGEGGDGRRWGWWWAAMRGLGRRRYRTNRGRGKVDERREIAFFLINLSP